MKIEFRNIASPDITKGDLSDLIIDNAHFSCDYHGALEYTDAVSKAAIYSFEKLVELLYKKGIFDSEDIGNLVEQLFPSIDVKIKD